MKKQQDVSKELKVNPSLNKQVYGTIPLEKRNDAQNLNIYDYTDKYGNQRNILYGKTRIGRAIARIEPINFGSLACYWVDTLPTGVKYMKGQEKMVINQTHHYCRGRAILNRRALSRMLATWSYLYDMRYWKGKSDVAEYNTAVGQWCVQDTINGRDYDLISGIEAIEIIRDIIRAVRNGVDNTFYEFRCQVNNPEEADEVVVLTKNLNEDRKVINTSLKQKYYKMWRFPKYSIDYLKSLIDELNSGNYYLDVYVPIIHDLHTYPIKCTDTHEKKYKLTEDEEGNLLDSEFKKAKTEYEESVLRNLQY